MAKSKSDHRLFIGQVILDSSILYQTKVTISDFDTEFDKRVFNAITNIFREGGQIDLPSILAFDKQIDAYQLSILTTDVMTSTWKQTELRIKNATRRRTLLNIAEMIQGNKNNDEVISEIFKQLEQADEGDEDSIISIQKSVDSAIDIIEERYKMQGVIPGITSGLSDLDSMILGFESRKLYVIGGRPSEGKTALLLNMLARCEASAGFISAESSHIELTKRLISIIGNVASKGLNTGYMKTSDFTKLHEAAVNLNGRQIYFYDEPNMHIDRLLIKARELKRRFDIKILFVDYIQCLTANMNIPRHEQVAHISKSLKGLARTLEIPVIASAQLRRESDDRRPLIGDFSDSKQIEQDADVAMLIHNKRVRDESGEEIRRDTFLLVEKNRDGETGAVQVVFRRGVLRFENYSHSA